MRAVALLLFYFFTAFVVWNISACDKMDDIQKQYADEEEHIYLGKVDSTEVIPGYGRVKLRWEISADPRVDRVKIYWNNHQDSTSKDFSRSISGNIKDSLIIGNLSEGNYTFELRTENDLGNTSLYSIVSGSVWGPNRADQLGSRKITSFGLDDQQSAYTLRLSPVEIVNPNDRLVFSEIVYQTTGGGEMVIKVPSDTSDFTLENFENGTEFSLRDVFVSTNVFDTIYNNFRTYTAPAVVTQTASGLGIMADPTSDFFAFNDSLVWEWTQGSEVIGYSLDGSGMVQKENVLDSGEFPRDSFDILFNYGKDRFITISPTGNVSMHILDNDTIAPVLNPDGAAVFGSGFTSFSQYIPSSGYFYTVTEGSGDLKTWLALDNATWGSPNGTTVGNQFDRYKTLTVHNSSLWGIDHDGFLWRISLKIGGIPDTFHAVGSGWGQFDRLISVGTVMLALDQSGEFYFFPVMPEVSEYWSLN